MPDLVLEAELVRCSDEYLGALAKLQVMELEKRALSPGQPRRQGMAVEIEELTLLALGRSQYQTRLTSEETRGGSIPPRQAPEALDAWRAAERLLRDAQLAVRRTSVEAGRAQDEYHRSVVRAGVTGD
jgi:hypothetical protein